MWACHGVMWAKRQFYKDSGISFPCGPLVPTQVFRHDSKHLYWLGHFTGLLNYIFKHQIVSIFPKNKILFSYVKNNASFAQKIFKHRKQFSPFRQGLLYPRLVSSLQHSQKLPWNSFLQPLPPECWDYGFAHHTPLSAMLGLNQD